jgi:arsenate reductase
MVKKIYCLSTCSTCKAIIKEIEASKKGFQLQDIQSEPISAAQLDAMKELAGSYEVLFSRRARKYREMGLQDKKLTEKEYRDLILQEYTFLKRPVVILGKKLFAGSEKKTLEYLNKAVR